MRMLATGGTPSAADWTTLVKEVQRLGRITVEPPLEVLRAAGGTHIRLGGGGDSDTLAQLTDCATKMITTTLAVAITSTGATTIQVTDPSLFPTSGNYTICVGQGGNLANEYTTVAEVMTVTAGQGTTTWTVTRSGSPTTQYCGAAVFLFSSQTVVAGVLTTVSGVPGDTLLEDYGLAFNDLQPGDYLDTVAAGAYPSYFSVNNPANLPTSSPFQVKIDGELMTVTAVTTNMYGTFYYVQRGQGGTAFVQHSPGATVQVVGYGPYSWNEVTQATTGGIFAPLVGGSSGIFNAYNAAGGSVLPTDGSFIVEVFQSGIGYVFDGNNSIAWYDRSGDIALSDQYMGRGNKVFDGLFLNWCPEIGEAGGFIPIPHALPAQGIYTDWYAFNTNLIFDGNYGIGFSNGPDPAGLSSSTPFQQYGVGGMLITYGASSSDTSLELGYNQPIIGSPAGGLGLTHNATSFRFWLYSTKQGPSTLFDSTADAYMLAQFGGYVACGTGFQVAGGNSFIKGDGNTSQYGIGQISATGGQVNGTVMPWGGTYAGGILLDDGANIGSFTNVSAQPLRNSTGIVMTGGGITLSSGGGGITVSPGGGTSALQDATVASTLGVTGLITATGGITLPSGAAYTGATGSTASFAPDSVDLDAGTFS